MKGALKFLVIDDHALTREGMRLALGALGDDVKVLEAASVDAGRQILDQQPDIDLVLLDIGFPGAGGFSLLEQLRREQNAVPIVVISGTDDRRHVRRALDLGALGFIPKSSSVEIVLHAVRLVLAGSIYIPPQALAAPFEGSGESVTRQGIGNLTDRQREILALMAKGKPNKLIADDLNISEATVKSHITEIFRVLGVSNRTQAVIAAGDFGLTE